MKKIIILCATVVLILTGCPIKNPGIGCEYNVRSFDRSQNPDPLFVTVEIENNTSKELTVTVDPMVGCLTYKCADSNVLNLLIYWCDGDNFDGFMEGYQETKKATIGIGKKTIFEKMNFMSEYYSALMDRTLYPGIPYPSDEDGKAKYPGVTMLALSIDDSSNYINYDSSNLTQKSFEGKNLRKLTVKDFEEVGGAFFYIQDPANSGTKKYGHLVCPSDKDGIDGLDSGHVKVRFILTEDMETGEIKVDFKSLGIVTEEE